jgi:phenylacetate-CoA ligase
VSNQVERSSLERAAREQLANHQLAAFKSLLNQILSGNRFYQCKMAEAGIHGGDDISGWNDYYRLPFTSKQELSNDQAANPRYGSNLTYPMEDYLRIHRTSGTTGQALRWMDTEADWDWITDGWVDVFAAAGITPADRIFFAFSFGPFSGFWMGYDAAHKIGALSIPGGGMSSQQRIRAILDDEVTVLCSTPTYALRLDEVAREDGIDLSASSVRLTINAGEPGAGLPATRRRIEAAWGAKCFDHAGATEVGPWGFECEEQAGLHLNEGSYIFEVIDPDSGAPAEEGELVVTNLGRKGSPVIRYRTGDRVRLASSTCACGRSYRRIDGGVIGRIDDALLVRGVSVYPSAIEDLVRSFSEVDEFAVDIDRRGTMDEMTVRIEVQNGEATEIAKKVERSIHEALSLRVELQVAQQGSLPRYELKARRFTDHRKQQ